MAHQKGRYSIILFSILALFLGCTRYSVFGESTLEIHAYNPATGEPIAGVHCKLYELEIKLSNNKVDSTLVFEGYTDQVTGKTQYTFLPKANKPGHTYDYVVVFDYDNMQLPPGNYQGLFVPNSVSVYFQQPIEYIPIKIAPTLSRILHIKNQNCLGSNDSMRYRIKYPHTISPIWSTWVPSIEVSSGYFHGCYEAGISSNNDIPQDSVYWEIEVTRNGNTSIIRDSMLLDPTKVQDTIKIYY